MALVRGGYTVLPHVQRFADDCQTATGASNYGTYPGHSPTPQRALDIFVPVFTTTLGNAICDFSFRNWDKYGMRYIIFAQRINWNEGKGWVWMEDRGSPTQNHYDHTHNAFEESVVWVPEPEPVPEPELPTRKDVAELFIMDGPESRGGGVWYTDGATWKRGVPNEDALLPWRLGYAPHLGVVSADYFDSLPEVRVGTASEADVRLMGRVESYLDVGCVSDEEAEQYR